ncbi:MAG: pyridoxamine 5'-phosphate oxidase family protein [Cyclobacteriaceae bacterium]|nr:pyridoxamine 5'-phosphate oxidase family protein [Cyclobacteriaceae bacterium]
MNKYEINDYNKVKRGANRAVYEQATVREILDSTFLCHVAYVWEGRPIVIPTAYGREGECIYLHGAVANRMMKGLLSAEQASLTVTHLDGLVLARSAFHHSANYRSVALFGSVKKLEGNEAKSHALKVVMEQMLPGRWDESRLPSEKELNATLVLEITIDYASAKIRSGDPVDDDEDYDLGLWAGVLPIKQHYENAIPDPRLKFDLEVPMSVQQKLNEN